MSGEVAILAAGNFPRRGSWAWRRLEACRRVVCCDSAAVKYRRAFGRYPAAIVGDLDSLPKSWLQAPCEVVRVDEQETNDLEKAIRFCRSRHWRSPVIFGALGRRPDHALGNFARALAAGLELVDDHGVFLPIRGWRRLRVGKGAAVSVFAADPATRMTSRGLEWPLDGVKFTNLYVATLNRATATWVEIAATHRAYVFVAGE